MRTKKILAILVLLIAFCSFSKAAEADNRLTYKILYDYSDGYVYKYLYNEKSNVKRTYDDKTKFNFSRDSKLYFKLQSTESSKNGFQTISVVTDSINHVLDSAGKKKWVFNTKDPNCFDNWNSDIAIYNVASGISYKYIISPYYEIADIIPSEQMTKDIKLIESSKDNMKATKFVIYRNALGKFNLNHIADVKKIAYPIKRVPKDSIWTTPIEFVINGVQFYDTVSVKFKGESGGYYLMESEFKLNKFINNQTVIYAPKQVISEPLNADLTCKLNLSVTVQGQIEETALSAEGNITYIDQDKKNFTDNIKTTMVWKADGRYRY